MELAKLFSIAVDFPKTGVPAEIPHEPHDKEYPDFMEKPHKPTYVRQCDWKAFLGSKRHYTKY